MEKTPADIAGMRADFEALAFSIASQLAVPVDISSWHGDGYTHQLTAALFAMYRAGQERRALAKPSPTVVENTTPARWGILVGEPEILGKRCLDGGTCHHKCATECFRRDGCLPLTGSGLNDDWSIPVHARSNVPQ